MKSVADVYLGALPACKRGGAFCGAEEGIAFVGAENIVKYDGVAALFSGRADFAKSMRDVFMAGLGVARKSAGRTAGAESVIVTGRCAD